MSERDWWSRWFKRGPFSKGSLWDISGILGEMEEMMEREFAELSKKAPKELIRERILPDGTKMSEFGPFVYGYSVTVGPDGKPQIREFGNVKPETRMGRPNIDIKEKREPLVDVMADDGEIKVLVELPGVDKEDIRLHGTENRLTISVDTPQRKYYKEVELPAKVISQETKSSYKNGVLEVTLRRKEEEKPKGEPIEVE
ncbi:MAG: Hsp20/alpha crystallin family protein [Candidatus Bathyarchaeota archaeon]|jgi:HSP20 family protein